MAHNSNTDKKMTAQQKTTMQYITYGAIILGILVGVVALVELYQYLATGPWAV